MVKAKGSWVKLDTPAQKIRIYTSHPPLYHHPEVSVGLSICRSRRSFFFEISPHHDFGLSSGLKWPKFWPTLGEPKRYFAHIPETLFFRAIIFGPLLVDLDIFEVFHLNSTVVTRRPNIIAESLRSVTQILAIFSKSFFKSAAVYFHKKTIF